MEKIQHQLFFENDDFNLAWSIDLPYRLNKGDFISVGLLASVKVHGTYNEMEEFKETFDYVKVDYVTIYGTRIDVWLVEDKK